MKVEKAFELVRAELDSACAKWPAMRSAHEGYAIVLEETDELWAAVQMFQKFPDADNSQWLAKEAVQVAAMALRFLIDICDG